MICQSRELGFLFIDQTIYLDNPFSLSYDRQSHAWSADANYNLHNRMGTISMQQSHFKNFFHAHKDFKVLGHVVTVWGKGIFEQAILLSFLNHYLGNNVVIISSTIPQVVRCAVYESSFFWTKNGEALKDICSSFLVHICLSSARSSTPDLAAA